MTIPFVDLKSQFRVLETEVRDRMDRVLEHGQFIMGPEVPELEGVLASYTGAQHCITVASGTEALLISLMALGIRPGDEVITTPFTFISTVEVITILGAKPVFVDIRADTCNLDPSKIEDKITARTRAIIPVSLYGQPADMKAINDIASRCGGIPVIEDAAQSFGAVYDNRRSCNLSTIGCTSFFPSKPLGCYGDGGAIFTSDPEIAEACRQIRVHGQSERYVHARVGVGGRMDTLQCAVVLAKMGRFPWEVERRAEIGNIYNHAMDELKIERVQQLGNTNSVFGQYTIMVDQRDQIRSRMLENGVPTAVHYPIPANEQLAYRDLCCPDCTPVASQIANRVMSIPMSPYLKNHKVDAVIKALEASICD